MAIFCGACGKLMKYTQSALSCSGAGCKAVAHYACVASIRQDWRCVTCCYPAESSVQYLLGEILKKGSGMELLQGLIGKINDLVTDINTIRDENEYLKKEIFMLTNNQNCLQNINSKSLQQNKRKTTCNNVNKLKSQIPITTIDLVSSEDETNHNAVTHDATIDESSLHTTSSQNHHSDRLNKKVSIFVTWSNTAQSETYLKQYLEESTKVKSIECIRVSCYDTYSMFQIKVDQNDADQLTNCDVYPQGCKLEVYRR